MKKGFYKKEDQDLFYAPNSVYAPTYTLLIEDYETYTYPVEGWYYFETEAEAKVFFNIVE